MWSCLHRDISVLNIPGKRQVYDITDFVQQEDCTATACDLAPAFKRVFDAITLLSPFRPQMGVAAGVITIPPGEFELHDEVILPSCMVIKGAGGGSASAATLLRVKSQTNGFVVPLKAQCSQISDMAIVTTLKSNVERSAILLNGRAIIENIYIRGFVNGIKIFGNVKDAVPSNVNGACVYNTQIQTTEHAAVWIKGPDANVNVFTALDVGGCCTRGEFWRQALGEPAAIIDGSFLGNTFIGAQTATTKDKSGVVYRGYAVTGASARSVFVGCYAESDQLKSMMSPQTVVCGGIAGWEGEGLRIEGQRLSGLRVSGVPAPGDVYAPELVAGNHGPPGTVLALSPPQSGSTVLSNGVLRWRLINDIGNRSWIQDVAGLGVGVASRISLEVGLYGVMKIKTATTTI